MLSAKTGRDIHEAEIEESMRFRPAVSLMLAAALLSLSAALSGCSKSDKGMSPAPATEPFESGDLTNSGPSSIFVHTFNTAGSFSYRCRHHGLMRGTVTVATGGADSVSVPIADFAFGTPSSPSVKVGGYVKWVNGGSTHTVTR